MNPQREKDIVGALKVLGSGNVQKSIKRELQGHCMAINTKLKPLNVPTADLHEIETYLNKALDEVRTWREIRHVLKEDPSLR